MKPTLTVLALFGMVSMAVAVNAKYLVEWQGRCIKCVCPETIYFESFETLTKWLNEASQNPCGIRIFSIEAVRDCPKCPDVSTETKKIYYIKAEDYNGVPGGR